MAASKSTVLSFIRGAEGRRGHDEYSSFAVLTPQKPVSTMTIGEVRQWQAENRRRGAKSTAVGGYQFIASTFNDLVEKAGMPDDTVFDAGTQDILAGMLLDQNGWADFDSGRMSPEAFGDRIAATWAALPRFSGPNQGRSHYAGDGLNGATRNNAQFLDALTQALTGQDVDLSGLPNQAGDGGATVVRQPDFGAAMVDKAGDTALYQDEPVIETNRSTDYWRERTERERPKADV